MFCTLSRHCQAILGNGHKHEFYSHLTKLFESNSAFPCIVRVGYPTGSGQCSAATLMVDHKGLLHAVGSDTAMIILHNADPSSETNSAGTPSSNLTSTPCDTDKDTITPALPSDSSETLLSSSGRGSGGGLVRQRSLKHRRVGGGESGGGGGGGGSRLSWFRERGWAGGVTALPSSPLIDDPSPPSPPQTS